MLKLKSRLRAGIACWWITALLAAMLNASILAEEPRCTEYPASALLEQDAVLERAAAVSREAYPNADTVLVDEHILVRYDPDGSHIVWDDYYVKILSEKGRRENQTLSLHFNTDYSRVEPLLIEVVKPDGGVRKVDIAAQSRIMVDPSQMGSNIYNPDDKIMKVTIPGLEPGDICHYRVKREHFKARMANTFSDWSVFEYTSPIMRTVYEVESPPEAPLESIALKDPVEGTVEYNAEEIEGGKTLHRWTVRDVPRMYEEPEMPPLHTVVQRLLISTIPDWETVSRWYWNLSRPRLDATTPEIEAKVDELTAGAGSDMEKVRRLFRFVSQEIRYMGITTEDEAPGYEPHDVSTTFENRYGVCRDKAALLVAMLRIAGLQGYPVLINVGPKKDPEVPQPYFNHAITAVELSPGEYTLMDPTDEGTRDLLPRYLCDKSYLVAKPEGETLKTSPIIPAEENMLRIESSGRIDRDGVLRLETKAVFEGVNDSIYRSYFARQKPEDLRRFFERIVRRGLPGANLEDFELQPANLLDTEAVLSARLVYSAADYAAENGRDGILHTPWIGDHFGVASFILRGTGLEIRKYPLATDIACGVVESISIDISKARIDRIELPEASDADSGKISYSQSYSIGDEMIKARSELKLEAVEYSPDDYRKLKEVIERRELAERDRPIYRNTAAFTETPDVRVLARDVSIDISDPHNWETRVQERKRILTYAGKKKNSELKLAFNPCWQTSVLDSARVIAADGSIKDIAGEEVNIMDAAWVAGAPRYPAEKLLVASLPGVEVGSIVETSITATSREHPFFSTRWHPNGLNPVEKSTLRLSHPLEMEISIETRNFNLLDEESWSSGIETNSGIVTHTWTVENLPGIKSEEDLPPWHAFNPTVFVSTGDWRTYVKELRTGLGKAASGQEEAARLAAELTTDMDGANQKAKAIRDYVAENINAAGPALAALPFSAITAADETIASGYGNTSDRAIVLFSMLQAAGLEPEFVLAASSASRMDSLNTPLISIPDRWMFDTVLLRMETEDGMVYFNDSNQYDALGTTEHDGLPGMDMEGDLFTICSLATRKDISETGYSIEIDASGDAMLSMDRKYYGTAFGEFHRRYAEMPPEERRRHYQELVSAVSEAASEAGPLITDYSGYPGRESFRVEIEGFARRKGDLLYFNLPRRLDSVIPVASGSRANPLYIPREKQASATYRIILPPETREVLILPENVSWDGPRDMGTLDFKTRIEEGDDGSKQLVVHQWVDFNPSIIPSQEYERLRMIDQLIESPSSWSVMLELNAD